MCIYLGTSEVSEGEMLFLLNAELTAVLSSYRSSQTFSKLSEDHLKAAQELTQYLPYFSS